MIDQYFLVLTTIDLFVLTFMCILTKLSETLNSKQKRGFFLAFVLIGVISILEVITILVDGAPVHLRWLNILSNYLGFGLSPAVSLCLVYVLDKKQGVRRGFKTAVACEAAYLISLALMLPGGMVFSVSEDSIRAATFSRFTSRRTLPRLFILRPVRPSRRVCSGIAAAY